VAPFGMTPRRFDQGDEQTVVMGVVLRVPLDAYGEPGADDLDRLNAAVVRKPDGLKPAAKPVDALVVMAVALSLHTEKRGDSAAGLEDNPVGPHLAERLPVGVVAQDLREVLVKRASEADVEQLQAPANGQQREVLFNRTLAERHLPGVPVFSRRVRLMVRGRPVQHRVNVGPAREDQAVHRFEHCWWARARWR
jgi:hypothetical protein